MKIKSSVVTFALSLGFLAAPLALSAKSTERAYVESYRGRTDIPVPVSVVMPDVSPRHAGTAVEVEFTIGASGKPENLVLRQVVDRELASTLTEAIAQWEFKPARVDGAIVARKLVLPLRIVASADGEALAMK
ncbi:MAG: energy transducer TonB [Opitutaceae bacterium]|nr:energy transducer TonB [Opitutaceae bacterium]